jgi:hypothetical protein
MHARGAVGAVVFCVDGTDLRDRPVLGRLALGAGQGSLLVPAEAGAGHPKYSAQPLNTEV